MHLTFHFDEISGKIKPMHAVGRPPTWISDDGINDSMLHYLAEANIPYSRMHDVGGHFGGKVEKSFSFSSLHTAGKSGLEPFAGKSLLQHVGTAGAEGGLDRLSFYGNLHDRTPGNKKRKGRRCLPFPFLFCGRHEQT